MGRSLLPGLVFATAKLKGYSELSQTLPRNAIFLPQLIKITVSLQLLGVSAEGGHTKAASHFLDADGV